MIFLLSVQIEGFTGWKRSGGERDEAEEHLEVELHRRESKYQAEGRQTSEWPAARNKRSRSDLREC